MMKNCEDKNKKSKLDKEFHHNIAKASRNFLIVTILNTISTLIDSLIKDARFQILKNEGEKNIIDYIDYEHERIYNALVKGNSQETATIKRMHMELINENFIKLTQENLEE